MRALLVLTLLLGALLLGCAEPSPSDHFQAEVAPIILHRCGSTSCHGVAKEAEASGETIDWGKFFFRVEDGQAVDQAAFYAAVKRTINTSDGPEFSSLLRKALPAAYGGLPHHGGPAFTSPTDPAYRVLFDWIASESGGGETSAPLSEPEQVFAATVQPHLAAAMCANSNCHGPRAAVPFHIDPGLSGRFSVAQTRANYQQAVKMLSLDGFPAQSRLLRKSLPLHAGGILHKGGNNIFFTGLDDPRSVAITNWAQLERTARVQPTPAAKLPTGLVYVTGPLSASGIFDLDQFDAGTHIAFASLDDTLKPSQSELITAGLGAEVDARDPAVDADGKQMVFSLRRSADEGHAIYVMDLATRDAKALTEHGSELPGGGLHTDRDPTFGPDGHIWFVSTRQGSVADGGELLDAELYELDPHTGELLRRTATPHIERQPVFFRLGKVAGEVAFTALRDVYEGQRHAHPFRFPPDLHQEYHQHFGTTPLETLFYDMRELPDGRYVSMVGELDTAWGAGGLAIVDRNFGPELTPGSTEPSSLPGYAPPCVRLDAPDLLYRDPIAAPDGRLLVSRAAGSDAADLSVTPDFGLVLLDVVERPDRSGPAVVGERVVIDLPGSSERDPAWVRVRSRAPIGEPAWSPDESTGVLVHQGLPMIDAILAALAPTGDKSPRSDMVFARLVESVPTTRVERVSTGLTRANPQRILAEVPLADDGSFQVRLPAGVPFRIQALDAERRAIGVPHNRWFYVSGGQKLPQGVRGQPTGIYREQCSICHGGANGQPDEVFGAVDAITMASVTLARFDDGNPRRPLSPLELGDATRVEVEFETDVQPILSTRCATSGCHDAAAAADLQLDEQKSDGLFTQGYQQLVTGGWVGERASDSGLLATLDTGHGGPLEAAELLAIVRWLDLGGGYALP